jgi:hypothetical protein
MFTESRAAIETGYWPLFRFDPGRKAMGENPFQLDSRKMHGELQVRFASRGFPAPSEGHQVALLSSERCTWHRRWLRLAHATCRKRPPLSVGWSGVLVWRYARWNVLSR